jgi:cardiolipin synthase
VQMINRDNYSKLINWGIKVYEYDGYLHSKCIIIDDEYALVGSCNFDYRSIYMNFESAIIVDSTQIISSLIKNFDNTKKNSLLLTNSFINKKLNLWTKFVLKLLNVGKNLF